MRGEESLLGEAVVTDEGLGRNVGSWPLWFCGWVVSLGLLIV